VFAKLVSKLLGVKLKTALYYNHVNILGEKLVENRTARLTILIDPQKKQLFEDICAEQDLTPSQVVRRLIRQYIVTNARNRELPDWLIAGAQRGEGEQ